jgi:hypothetical protein
MDKILKVFNWLGARLKEPSTMAAVASIGTAVHVNIDPGIYQQSVDILIAISGILGIVLKEKGS